jgi:hypothetical protein
MPTVIYTDQPSTGKSIQFAVKDLGISWTTLAEVPIFSIPRISSELPEAYIDTSRPGEEREFLLGELFITAPLLVSNKSEANVNVDVQILTENNEVVQLTPTIPIPPKDGVRVNIQGQIMRISTPGTANGDRLQIKASVANAVDVFGSATESGSADHAPDTESL